MCASTHEQRRPLRIELVLEDFREKFLRCGPRPHIGSVVGRSARCGEAVIGAAVEFQLPIDLGLAQFLDREIQLQERGGRVFSAVQDEDAALDVLHSPRREVAERAVDHNRPDDRRAGMTQFLRDHPAEAIADDGDSGWIDHGILPQRIETGLRARPHEQTVGRFPH